MKVYYKATRPDGFDFYSQTVDYASALESRKPLKRKPRGEPFACCTDTVYHASDTPSETLIGGSWPCRLFEVTGRPVAQEGHKFGFRSLRVAREIPAWKALGPNGEKVAALIERIKVCTEEEIDQLDAAWDAARVAARDAAWDAARDAALDAAWDAARDAALDAARVAAWDAAWDAAWVAARDAAWDAAWDAARGAALDAARALTVEDLVGTGNFTQEHFDLLYGPWGSVIGEVAV